MRVSRACVVGVVFCVCGVMQGPGIAWAQPEEKPPTISTSGTGTVVVQPDAVRVHLGVMTQAKQLPDARQQNAEQARAAMDALAKLRLPGLAIKSTGARVTIVWPEDRYVERQLRNALGFRVTHEFTARVTSDSPDELGTAAAKIVDTAIDAGGANILGDVSFFKEDVTAAHQEALAKGAAAARANAEALAQGLGVKLTGVTRVSGSPRYREVTYNQRGERQFDEPPTSTPLVAGEIVISCEVSLTAEFGPG